MPSPLEDSFDALIEALRQSTAFVRQHPFYSEPENRVVAHSFLASMLIARLEEEVIFDPDFPYFRILDPRIREGGDNPDQRYLIARIRGGETYRIWGNVGTARRVELQIYAGDPYVPGSGGRAASFLTYEQLNIGADGSFEIIASSAPPTPLAGPPPANWIENPPDATRILARQVFSDWGLEDSSEMHIDLVGREGALKPETSQSDMAARLRRAAESLTTHVRVWPEMVRTNYLARTPANQVSVPFDPGSVGGVPGRFMCHGVFDLADDEAMVIKTWPANGNYQGIQLADLWFSSLEYANRQTSLTGDQSYLSTDGYYCYVVSSRDPGVQNWLDTVGRQRGVILFRFDGTTGAFDPAHHPQATVVKFDALASTLPPDTPRCGPTERSAQLATRHRHVQRRFGF